MAIRAVIFDLGGVLVRTADFSPRERLGAPFGMNAQALEDLVFGLESGRRAQLGQISAEQHWEHVRQQLGLTPEGLKDFQDVFWSQDFLDHRLVAALRGWRATCRTALLSNAFSTLRALVTEQMKIADAFDELIISAEVGMMKPDVRIYQLALQRLGVQAEQAAFVDDMRRNIDAANALGMQGIQYQDTPQVLADLDKLLSGG